MRRWIIGVFACVLLGFGTLWLLDRLSDLEIPAGQGVSAHQFGADGVTYTGTLILPNAVADGPVALIVHGDGPQDRWGNAGYLPLINALVDRGIGVFTWDKPGVGGSTGNWLDQSFDGRVAETVAAHSYLRDEVGIAAERRGFLGFSQAGWVVPAATQATTPRFTVLVGVAVNLREQGAYFTRRRLEREGMPPAQIPGAVAANLADSDRTFAGGATGTLPTDMEPERAAVVRRSYDADASADVEALQGPLLALWGAEDLNVDAAKNAALYRTLAPRGEVAVLPDATHALLRAAHFNYQLVEQWPKAAMVRFALMGRDAYAPGAIDRMANWIRAQTEGSLP